MAESNNENLTPLKFVTTAILNVGKRNCACVYKNIWEVAVGETLSCVRELRNARDQYAVAVEKNGTVVRHLLA